MRQNAPLVTTSGGDGEVNSCLGMVYRWSEPIRSFSIIELTQYDYVSSITPAVL